MRKQFSAKTFGVVLTLLCASLCLQAPSVSASKSTLGTVTGAVHDNHGNPVAGALISIMKIGADKVIKQIRSDADGRFKTRISPGRYGLRAMAQGFNAVVFDSVEVRASQELVYKFNLEPVGEGRTLPERRNDSSDVKWTLRSSHTRKSIFQVQEDEDGEIQAALGIEPEADPEVITIVADDSDESYRNDSQRRMRGVVETYFAANSFGTSYPGLNFALATSPTDDVELIFSGQVGADATAPERFEATSTVRLADRHRVAVSVGAVNFGAPAWLPASDARLGQFSVRAIDEWIVRDGIVVVLGLDYSRFIGAGGGSSISPRIGFQFDANARTRVKAAFAPGGDEGTIQSVAAFEGAQVVFREANARPVAFVDGRAVTERSHRLEFGVERVVDNESSFEASAFFDTTSGRGVGLMSTPSSAFSGDTGDAFISVANQQGAARGMRLLYTRRLSRVWTASAGYSFGRGQQLSDEATQPTELFENGFFQSAALQLGAGFDSGTNIRTVLRFSPNATVFAIDPFAGRLAVYDPSLSIQVTQELPSFGLPLRAQAVIDARNLLDLQANTDNGEILTQLSTGRRSVRGGISVRF
ncbi:MAG TPA: carboxypeptidase-like regulatory domain-containing protein [Pyrinomonadaceae bacterium]|nr:carboxypeptidase-like regulatory domain-containing protein [Pyrinomonadaceae bacterium]